MSRRHRRPIHYSISCLHDGTVLGAFPVRKPTPHICPLQLGHFEAVPILRTSIFNFTPHEAQATTGMVVSGLGLKRFHADYWFDSTSFHQKDAPAATRTTRDVVSYV